MAILRVLPVLLLAACYAPDLDDCTVTCTSDADCAGGQRCTDRVCAREGVVCTGEPPGDAAVSPMDGPTDSPPDGPIAHGLLRVRIDDEGIVRVPNQASCDSLSDQECTYTVPLGQPLTLEADPHEDRFLEKWDEACGGQQGTVCTITPTQSETRVTARFKRLPDD